MPQSNSPQAVTLSVRISTEMRDRLEELSDATGRTKSFLAAEALEHYLQHQSWQVKATKDALNKANSKEAKFFEHEAITHWLSSWGNNNEQEPPK